MEMRYVEVEFLPRTCWSSIFGWVKNAVLRSGIVVKTVSQSVTCARIFEVDFSTVTTTASRLTCDWAGPKEHFQQQHQTTQVIGRWDCRSSYLYVALQTISKPGLREEFYYNLQARKTIQWVPKTNYPENLQARLPEEGNGQRKRNDTQRRSYVSDPLVLEELFFCTISRLAIV